MVLDGEIEAAPRCGVELREQIAQGVIKNLVGMHPQCDREIFAPAIKRIAIRDLDVSAAAVKSSSIRFQCPTRWVS